MSIGSFGPVVWSVSSGQVKNFEQFVRAREATFAEHPVLDHKPRLQHIGTGLDEITFDMKFVGSLNVDPMSEIDTLRGILEAGDEKPLIMGGKVLGDFVLTKMEEKWTMVDNKGRVPLAVVSVTLKEFLP